MTALRIWCRCGHTAYAHTHLDSSEHCALCRCARYRRAHRSLLCRLLDLVGVTRREPRPAVHDPPTIERTPVAWTRYGDTAPTAPVTVAVAEHEEAEEWSVNEVHGWAVRLFGLSAAHLTDRVVSRGSALQLGGSRTDHLVKLAIFAGYMTEIRLDDGRVAYEFLDDPEFLHMRTKEEVTWERQRKADNQDVTLKIPVRFRDGDACRYCGLVVSWTARKGRLAATYDHREPGKAASVDTYVVACGRCNAGRGNNEAADQQYALLPAPLHPYYGPQTRAMFAGSAWAEQNGYHLPPPGL